MEKTRFTGDEIREIRRSATSARQLAKIYGVSHPCILNIRARRTYKHVPDYSGEEYPSLDIGLNLYTRMNALDLLKSLPAGYCPTIVTSPPRRISYHLRSREERGPASDDYIDWQREVIAECIRVAGLKGIVLYHQTLRVSDQDGLDTKHELVQGFPLKKLIIWNHLPPASSSGYSEFLVSPDSPISFSFIYIFAGRDWSMPEELVHLHRAWGDVWHSVPIYERDNRLISFPDELADLCISLGRGTVLDPFAAAGAIPLAAIRAGRTWLACDARPDLIERFREKFEQLPVESPTEAQFAAESKDGGVYVVDIGGMEFWAPEEGMEVEVPISVDVGGMEFWAPEEDMEDEEVPTYVGGRRVDIPPRPRSESGEAGNVPPGGDRVS